MRKAVVGVAVSLICAAGAAPASASLFTVGPLTAVQMTPDSPYGSSSGGAACQRHLQSGTNFPGTAVEPWLAVDPANPQNMVGAWQQDRFSNGGSVGLRHAYSTDGGSTWLESQNNPAFSNCEGATEFERATDPWVSIQPDGTAWSFGLGINDSNGINAMMVSKSTDHGARWGGVTELRRDTSTNTLNDKNSITADPYTNGYVYAVWDRLEFPNDRASSRAGERATGYRGPTWFARKTPSQTTFSTNSGHQIYDPGEVNQTIGNQIVVLRDGTLVDTFNLIYNFKNAHKVRGSNVAFITSSDKGASWSSKATIIAKIGSVGVTDPTDGHPVRTGDIIPEVSADPSSAAAFYVVWQDARFSTDGTKDVVVMSRVARNSAGAWTWTAPKRISTQPATQAFTPSVRVRSDGTVAVTYYDLRNDTAAAPLWTDMWAVHSDDQGKTFRAADENRLTPGSFNMANAADARGYFVGDYEGLGETGQKFRPFFAQVARATPPRESEIESEELGG